ncbi:MAG TPA: glycosyltransferase family 39 protein [Candidatus Acidoferrales bacterium]|nr:glycosyltransferase family 39 protein [Candidatus Acidoferrales bacterium]
MNGPDNRPPCRSLRLAILVALAARLVAAAFCYPDITKPRLDHWPFGYETGRIARSIATGQGFGNPLYHHTGPTAWMAPIYPYLMAGVFRVFGIYTTTSALAILGLQGLFSALTCIPIFFIARRWFGARTALWAAWMWALFPYAIYLSADFVWENCFTTLLLALLVWLGMELDRPRSLWAWVGYGLLWGFTAMVNPAALAVLPLVAGWALLRLRRGGGSWRAPAAALALTFLAAVAPWEIRNYRTFHQWLPFRDNFWLEVWVGNNGDTTLRWADSDHPSNSPAELRQYEALGEIRYMALKRRQSLTFIRSHPETFAWLTVRRIFYTWTGYWDFDAANLADEPYDPANIFFATPLTLLMAFGLLQAWRRKLEGTGLMVWILAVYPLVYYVSHPDIRYRHIIDPEIVLLAVYAVTSLRERAREAAEVVWLPSEPALELAETAAGPGDAGLESP